MNSAKPTPFAEVNVILGTLLASVQAILGTHLIGMYLDGSLATGDFDAASDIDFMVVTEIEVTDTLFMALRSMHDRIATLDSVWAMQLEGSYISQPALRRYHPDNAPFPNIERGGGERLKMVPDGLGWITHRSVLRECGITLIGPDPRTLIEPVTPHDLRQAMLAVLCDWGPEIPQQLEQFRHRGFQSYVVLTLCRILYTLQYGSVASKLTAARWAQGALDIRWAPLIEGAWEGRQQGGMGATAEDIENTLALSLYAMESYRHPDLTVEL